MDKYVIILMAILVLLLLVVAFFLLLVFGDSEQDDDSWVEEYLKTHERKQRNKEGDKYIDNYNGNSGRF